jgi:hypothetical protein
LATRAPRRETFGDRAADTAGTRDGATVCEFRGRISLNRDVQDLQGRAAALPDGCQLAADRIK